jgi:carboxymethylenebutenolidase
MEPPRGSMRRMCTSHDSRPPIEPISGAAIDAGPITLKGEDGAAFRAYLARPEQSQGAGVLILPDVRGLHPFFEELALRFAERGMTALAIDYFGRTAGSEKRGEGFEHMPHVDRLRWDDVHGDIKAAVAHLRSVDPAPRSVLTLGFCMGGRFSSLSATLGLGLAGVIPFYGWPVGKGRADSPAPADLAARIECDVLAIYGEADTAIPKDARDAFDAALDKAGVKHETIVYPDAPHGFFDKKAEDFADAATDAWDRVITFIHRHTQGQPFAAAPPATPTGAGARVATSPDSDELASSDPRVAHWTGDEAGTREG